MTIETIHRVDARGLACPMPIPSRLWHLGRVVSNRTYWRTVPKGRV